MRSDPPSSGQPPDGTPPPVPPPTAGGTGAGAGPGDEGGAARRKPFLLRLAPELMEELKGWSTQEFRSVNAHIEYLLREAVKKRKGGAARSSTRRKESP